jgi:membrane-bound lytic murein transglycosylase B
MPYLPFSPSRYALIIGFRLTEMIENMAKRLSILIVGLLCSPLALGQDDGFSSCLTALQDRARAEQMPTWVIDTVLAKLEPQPQVIALDRSQPEFTQTFADYFSRRVTPERIDQGRRLRDEYQPFLSKVTPRYGVPGQYLIAFWGLETHYGGYLGTLPTLDALATLACDDRRHDYFSNELMAALMLLNRESLTPQEMQGSWAGAMGHTQFMPSAYLNFAVDGNHDGHVNLWKSERDALASAANFLENLGWQRGERWGREVLLPANFPYAQSGLENRQPIRHWASLGVRLTNKARLPDVDMQGSILLPSGHTGPAFLVYHNFEVIMGWNRSEFYALSVGLLADRIAGGSALLRPPASEPALSHRTITRLQERLNHLGFNAGKTDGIMGTATRAALRAFQGASGMIADGYPDGATLRALAVDTEPT